MPLHKEWKQILKKAWSIRLLAAAGLFTGAESIVPLFANVLPHQIFAPLAFICVGGAFVARLLAQKGMQVEPD